MSPPPPPFIRSTLHVGRATHRYEGNAEHAMRSISPNTPRADRSTPPVNRCCLFIRKCSSHSELSGLRRRDAISSILRVCLRKWRRAGGGVEGGENTLLQILHRFLYSVVNLLVCLNRKRRLDNRIGPHTAVCKHLSRRLGSKENLKRQASQR